MNFTFSLSCYEMQVHALALGIQVHATGQSMLYAKKQSCMSGTMSGTLFYIEVPGVSLSQPEPWQPGCSPDSTMDDSEQPAQQEAR